jgi:hypothetical protein
MVRLPFGAPLAVEEGLDRKLIMDDVERKNRDRGASPHVPTRGLASECVSMSGKKVGFPLGTGNPEKARSIASVVSHRRVGSSNLASLSEAGGNELKNGEQAPSPSLTAFYISSCKTRLHSLKCNRAAIV